MRLAVAAVALISCSASVAQAQTGNEIMDRAPKKIYEFVRYCTDHFNDCQSIVVVVANEAGPDGCPIGIKDNEAATKTIVSWLARREETHAMSTKIGIRTAIRALWHC